MTDTRKTRFSIPTEYKGITFRSKLEADWARFFDELGIEWLYEPKGRYVGSIFCLCDFELAGGTMLFEVKGVWDRAEWKKYVALADQVAPVPVFLGGPRGLMAVIDPGNHFPNFAGLHLCLATPRFTDWESLPCRQCGTTGYADISQSLKPVVYWPAAHGPEGTVFDDTRGNEWYSWLEGAGVGVDG